MAVFLAAPDLGRLARLFVWNRRVPPGGERPLFAGRRGNRAALVFRTVFILYFVAASLHQSYVDIWRADELGVRKRMNGIWEVEEFTVDGAVRPLLVTDETLWRRLVFEWAWVVGIQYAHETAIREYELRPDPGPHMYTLCCDPEWQAAISFQRIEPDVLALEGTVDGRQIRGRYRRVPDSRFPLVSRGFHWINERPLNR
jgi:hypothetical protein